MTIIRKKKLLLLGAALVIFAASLLFCRGSKAATTYTIKDNPIPLNEYASLNDLFNDNNATWQGDDIIVLEKDDNSMAATKTFNHSVTIRSSGGLWTVSTSSNGIDPLFKMDGAGLTLMLENVNITGCDNAGGNAGSAIDFSGGPHTLVIIGAVSLTGGSGGSNSGGPAVYVYPTTPLTITGDGTGVFTGGTGSSADGNGLTAHDSLTVSGNGSFTFNGEAGLECDSDVTIGGGRVTATGNQVGANIGGNLQIDAGAAFSATGGDRGITFQGGVISGEGDLTASSTGTMGICTGIFISQSPLTLSLTGDVRISGPLGGIGMTDFIIQLTLQGGPASGKSWVIDGSPQKAFTYVNNLWQVYGLPSANFAFTGALAGRTYDTDVGVFMLPVMPAPSPNGGGWFFPPKTEKPVPAPAPFPAQGIVTGRRINVYKYETLKTVLFRMSKDEVFTILALANNGRALYIEKDGRQGYIAIRDIKATFGAAINAAALKKAGAYSLLESGKYRRVGYFDKEQVLWIHGISGKYLINRQTNATYYLDAAQWRLSLSAASGG